MDRIIWKHIWHKHVKATFIESELLKLLSTIIGHFGSSILSFVYVEEKCILALLNFSKSTFHILPLLFFHFSGIPTQSVSIQIF